MNEEAWSQPITRIEPNNVELRGYPINELRNYGPSGLSVASDRWDVRWAVVLEGRIRGGNHDYETITLYVDYQTLLPLYVINFRIAFG